MESKKTIDNFYCDAVDNGKVPCETQCAYCLKTVGLGDVVESITEATGIKKFVQKFVTNGPCDGCEKRKHGLNHVRIKK